METIKTIDWTYGGKRTYTLVAWSFEMSQQGEKERK